MKVRFLQDESGDNGTITWKYRKGEVCTLDDLPSGEASAYRWQDMGVVEIIEEDAPTPEPAKAAPKAPEPAPEPAADVAEASAPAADDAEGESDAGDDASDDAKSTKRRGGRGKS